MTSAGDFSIVEMVDDSPVGGRGVIEELSSDPLRFFHLDHAPFADCVNPDLFYRTDAHESAFIAMKRCIEEDVSLGLTTAAAGTGKTLLTQVLLQELAEGAYKPVLILIYPKMSRTALLRELAGELGVELPKTRVTTHDLVSAIQQKIMDLFLEGVKPVLIVDEVHFLTAENLHVLRTLSNIEVPAKKIVTILLFGETSFLKKMKNPSFRSILSRMYTRVELPALNVEEIEQYVKYRLLLSNGSSSLFDPACFAWLEEASDGIPRDINRLCHNALRLAAERSATLIVPQLIADANPLEVR